MLRRFFVRSPAEPTSSRQPSRQLETKERCRHLDVCPGCRRIKHGDAPAPPAEAIHGNSVGGSGKYTQVIDWID